MPQWRQYDQKRKVSDKPVPSRSAPSTPEEIPLLRLQRQIGNQSLMRTLTQEPEVGAEGGPISAELAHAINIARGRGLPLATRMRRKMEQRFTTDFKDVRVHSDEKAQDFAAQVSAQAFTTGNDIFLGSGASTQDQSLMGHELTHIVQQRTMPTGGAAHVTAANDSHEKEAKRAE